MSYLLKGLFFDVRRKILFTTENIAMAILPDTFCLFSYSPETINETCHFFPPSHLIKSYCLVQKCHFNISTHSCSVWLLGKKEKVLCIPKQALVSRWTLAKKFWVREIRSVSFPCLLYWQCKLWFCSDVQIPRGVEWENGDLRSFCEVLEAQ